MIESILEGKAGILTAQGAEGIFYTEVADIQ